MKLVSIREELVIIFLFRRIYVLLNFSFEKERSPADLVSKMGKTIDIH